ncbi:MAG: glutathione S-transferase family protein [Variovorax sp.]
MTATLHATAEQARHGLGNPPEDIDADISVMPRFELFNAPNSICSQKVRAVLAHHHIPYRSQLVKIFAGQTYLPDYVRLRLIGCDALGGELMSVHTGSTSVSAGGCDPAVVPTLIDWATNRVLVDSKRISFFLDQEVGGSALRPKALESAIDAELHVVDNMPNYQMLTGKPPGQDHRPEARRKSSGVDFAMSKVARCDAFLAEHADDADLVRGYSAKRSKELTAAQNLFTPEAMRTAYDKAEAGCDHLEQKLKSRNTEWLLADSITMADLYWAVELLRLQNMAAESFWVDGKRPAIEAFFKKAKTIPAIKAAVLDWPGALF